MNPLTNMKNIKKLSEQELHLNSKTSWHDQYKDSAWIFVGGLPYDLSEGDIICIFSQYGEIVNINLVRDKDTGKSKGFCFICYEDQRSTILAVDNFNGIKVLGRILRVDHVHEYKIPKEGKKTDEETKRLYREGCAPQAAPKVEAPLVKVEPNDIRETLADQISGEIRLPSRLPIYPIKREKLDNNDDNNETHQKRDKKKKDKKKKKKKEKSKKKKSHSSDDSSVEDNSSSRSKKKSYSVSSGSDDSSEERKGKSHSTSKKKHQSDSNNTDDSEEKRRKEKRKFVEDQDKKYKKHKKYSDDESDSSAKESKKRRDKYSRRYDKE